MANDAGAKSLQSAAASRKYHGNAAFFIVLATEMRICIVMRRRFFALLDFVIDSRFFWSAAKRLENPVKNHLANVYRDFMKYTKTVEIV